MDIKEHYNYTYVPPKDSDRTWKIEDIRDGRGMGAYTKIQLKKGQPISDSHYFVPYGEAQNFSIAITELGRFHNHSEKPTCKAVKLENKYVITTINDMEIGTEITVNYDDYLSTVNVERMNDEWKKGE